MGGGLGVHSIALEGEEVGPAKPKTNPLGLGLGLIVA